MERQFGCLTKGPLLSMTQQIDLNAPPPLGWIFVAVSCTSHINVSADGALHRELRMCHLSRDEAGRFYSVHQGKHFFDRLLDFMTSGRIVAIELLAPGPMSPCLNLGHPKSLLSTLFWNSWVSALKSFERLAAGPLQTD